MELKAVARDLYEHRDVATVRRNLTVEVPTNSVIFLKLTPDFQSICDTGPGGGLATRSHALGFIDFLSGLQDNSRQDVIACTECARLELDSWRPWHHGFFGHLGSVPTAQLEAAAS
jgi:hypothetical protein